MQCGSISAFRSACAWEDLLAARGIIVSHQPHDAEDHGAVVIRMGDATRRGDSYPSINPANGGFITVYRRRMERLSTASYT
jgi:hypothetical protein